MDHKNRLLRRMVCWMEVCERVSGWTFQEAFGVFTVLSRRICCRLWDCIHAVSLNKHSLYSLPACRDWEFKEISTDIHQWGERGNSRCGSEVFTFLPVFVWFDKNCCKETRMWQTALFTLELNHTLPSKHKLLSMFCFCFLVSSYIYRLPCEHTVGDKAAKSVAAGGLSVEEWCSVKALTGSSNVVWLNE